MMTPVFRLLLLAGALAPALAQAQDKPPPISPNATVYVGPCVSPALNGPRGPEDADQGAFLASVLAAAVPSLIGSGLDWIGAQLTALGEDKKTTLLGTRATEAGFGDRTCMQIARWSAEGQRLDALLAAQPGWSKAADQAEADARAAIAAAEGANAMNKTWERAAISQDRPLDFFLEFWVRPSMGREVISLTPTLLYYPHQLTDRRNGQKDAAVIITSKLEPSGETAASWTWALMRQAPSPGLQVLIPPRSVDGGVVRQRLGELRRLCETLCETASPWTGNPWAEKTKRVAAGGGLAAGVGPAAAAGGPKATNVKLEVTEIRAGSAFFKAVGAAFTAAKPVIKTGLEEAVLPGKRAQAEATATTASATALATYATKVNDADTVLKDKYCAAKGKPGINWSALSAELRSKQLHANVAAEAAEVAAPFPTPVPVTNALAPSLCA